MGAEKKIMSVYHIFPSWHPLDQLHTLHFLTEQQTDVLRGFLLVHVTLVHEAKKLWHDWLYKLKIMKSDGLTGI